MIDGERHSVCFNKEDCRDSLRVGWSRAHASKVECEDSREQDAGTGSSA